MPRAGDLVDHLLDDVARRMLPEDAVKFCSAGPAPRRR